MRADERNWVLIVAITAGVGGLLLVAVVVTVVVQIVVLCRKSRR